MAALSICGLCLRTRGLCDSRPCLCDVDDVRGNILCLPFGVLRGKGGSERVGMLACGKVAKASGLWAARTAVKVLYHCSAEYVWKWHESSRPVESPCNAVVSRSRRDGSPEDRSASR